MVKKDIYTGLLVNEEPVNVLDVQTLDKENAAVINGYATDPNQRMISMNQQQQAFNPFAPQQPQYIPNQGGYIPYQPYMSPYRAQFQQNNSFGFAGNPVFGMYGQQQPWGMYNNVQPQAQDRVVHVPGVNFGSTTLFQNDIEDVCNKMQVDMMMEQETAALERQERIQGYFNNNGYYNYYGMPYYGFSDTTVINKYRNKIEEMRKEGQERRIEYNKNLKRLCNNILGEEMSEEELDNLFRGYDYTIPAAKVQAMYDCDRFSKMVPVSNQHLYAKNFQELHNFYNGIMGQMEKQDLNGFLGALGIVQVCENLEQEYHNRRDGSRLYDSDSYKRYLRKHIAERNGLTAQQNNNQPFLNPAQAIDAAMFPVMSQSAKILDDGTISVTAPPWLGGSTGRRILVNNEMENHFEENRRAFLNSIYAQGG